MAVSDKTVRETIANGAQTVDEVTKGCRAGGDCGACHDMIEDMIGEAQCQRRLKTLPVVQDERVSAA